MYSPLCAPSALTIDRECVRQLFHELPYLVADAAIVPHRVFFRRSSFGESRRIVKPNVHNPGVSWEHRAGFMRRIADGDDVIKINADVLGPLARVAGNINSNFSHGAHSERIKAVRLRTR